MNWVLTTSPPPPPAPSKQFLATPLPELIKINAKNWNRNGRLLEKYWEITPKLLSVYYDIDRPALRMARANHSLSVGAIQREGTARKTKVENLKSLISVNFWAQQLQGLF